MNEHTIMPPDWYPHEVCWSPECYRRNQGEASWRQVWVIRGRWCASWGGFLLEDTWPTAWDAAIAVDRLDATLPKPGAKWYAPPLKLARGRHLFRSRP